VRTEKRPGRHPDGGGLHLNVAKSGNQSWVFLYRSPVHRIERNGKLQGRPREMGLGPVDGPAAVSLADARARVRELRMTIEAGKDPLDDAERERAARSVSDRSFGAVADRYVATHQAAWRGGKTKAGWRLTLEHYAAPIRGKNVAEITVEDVLRVLTPIWLDKPETAAKTRGRIEAVLDAAKAVGLRSGENPAGWRGNLKHLLPKRQKLTRGHHAAMPWRSVPGFVSKLWATPSMSAYCLEFVILTAARQGEVVRSVRNGEVHGMCWDEVNRDARVWTVPAVRMKTGAPHVVPLSDRALEILDIVGKHRTGPFVFTGQSGTKPLSEMALTMLLRGILDQTEGAPHATVHGFRSSFRDWCGDATSFPRDLAEMALSHTLESDVEAAYRRETAVEKRRVLMQTWADFVGGEAVDKGVPFARRP
jgi:integrase